MSYRQPDHETYKKPRPAPPTVEYARAKPEPAPEQTKPRSILRDMFSFWWKPKD